MNTVLKATGLMTVLPLISQMWRSNLDRERKYNIWIQFTQPVEYQRVCGSRESKCCSLNGFIIESIKFRNSLT